MERREFLKMLGMALPVAAAPAYFFAHWKPEVMVPPVMPEVVTPTVDIGGRMATELERVGVPMVLMYAGPDSFKSIRGRGRGF